MVYHHVDDGIKRRALYLQDLGWQQDAIEAALGINARKSIPRWRNNLDIYGRVSSSSSHRGPCQTLTPPILRQLRQLLVEDPTLYLDEILEWLAVIHNVRLSTSAMCRTLIKMGLTRKRLRTIAAQRDEEQRAAWFEYVSQTFGKEQLVFIDESSKDGRTLARHYGRAPKGMTPELRVDYDHGTHYSILPALSLDGYIALRVVEGSVDGEELYDFVVNDLLPKMAPFPAPRSVLVLDNCNTHKSDALRDAVIAHGCILVFLPPYSPDLNPIEESFSCVKDWLRRNWRHFQDSLVPEVELMEVCLQAVNAEKAAGWFAHSGYI